MFSLKQTHQRVIVGSILPPSFEVENWKWFLFSALCRISLFSWIIRQSCQPARKESLLKLTNLINCTSSFHIYSFLQGKRYWEKPRNAKDDWIEYWRGWLKGLVVAVCVACRVLLFSFEFEVQEIFSELKTTKAWKSGHQYARDFYEFFITTNCDIEFCQKEHWKTVLECKQNKLSRYIGISKDGIPADFASYVA